MWRVIVAAFGLLLCFAQQPAVGETGVIAGTVSGEDGSPVVGAYVTLHLSFTPGQAVRQAFRTHWGVYSGSGGSFRFTGLRNGTYRLCVQAPGAAWLDPCEWGLAIPSGALSSAVRSQAIAISLRRGAEVPISIDDPGQLVLQSEGRIAGALLLIGVRTPTGTFRPAVLTSRGLTGRTLKVVIPFDKPVNLTVGSSFFRLADSTGTPFSGPGRTIPLSVPAGQTPATVRLSVTGVK